MNRRNAIAYAILALVPTLLFWDVLTGVRSFYHRDFANYHYPLKQIAREIVLAGEFPSWNPYLSGGQPLAANPAHQVFYPLNWLILLPSYRIGLHLLVLVHLYLAAFGTYALLRSMRASRAASVIGGLSFGLGGLLLSMLHLLPFLFSSAWIPWIALFARRACRDGSRRDFVFATLCLGLQFLVGEPTTSLQTGLLLGIYAIAQGVKHGGGAAIARALAIVAAMSIGALAVSAVQILPGIDHFRDSTRGGGIALDSALSWSTPPVRFAEIFYPDLLGNPNRTDRDSYWGVSHYPRRQLPFFFGIYPGLLISILALTGLLIGARGRALYATIAVVSLLLALGAHTPLFELLYKANVVSAIRYPEKFLIMGIFATVIFASLVLDRLLRGDMRARRIAIATAGVVALIAIAAALMPEATFRSLWRVPESIEVSRMLPRSQRGWWIAAARGALLVLILASMARTKRRVALALLGAFVLVDVGMIVARLAERCPSDFYDAPPAVVRQFPLDRTPFRILHASELIARSSAYQEPHPDAHWVTRNRLAPPTPATYGLRMALSFDYDLTALQVSEDLLNATLELQRAKAPDWLGTIASMSNVWYVGIYRPEREAFAEAKGDLRRIQPVKFVEVRHAPRYYFASELVPSRDRNEFVRLLTQRAYGRTTAFVVGQQGRPARGTVRSVRDGSNGARLEVETEGTAFLVMSITPHKYWNVAVDGEETPSFVTNVGYQGIVVPGGRHIVEMRYRNPLITAGAVVSVLALLVLARVLVSAARDDQHITERGDPGDSAA